MKNPDLLLLSAGDFYAKSGIAEMYRSRFLSSTMMGLGYTAVAVGENELGYGLRAIRQDADAGLPVICANLYWDGERIFPASVIKKVRGTRVGIFALLDEEPKEPGRFEIRDPVAEGMVVMKELAGRCDFTILLAHMSVQKLKAFLMVVDDIDLVIRGHAKTGAAVSDDCVETLDGVFEDLGIPVLFAGERGKAIGMAGISFGQDGVAVLSDTMLIHLEKTMPRDPQIAKRMKEFGVEEGSRIRQMNLSEFLSRDKVTGRIKERFLGIETCERCHEEIMADFMTTKHFRAFNVLTVAGEEKNPECLVCHTTGYGQFSGYDPKAEEKGGINLQGVHCEACHGQGTIHTRDGKYRNFGRTSCRRCHTLARSPEFVFDEYMKRFGHCVDLPQEKEDGE